MHLVENNNCFYRKIIYNKEEKIMAKEAEEVKENDNLKLVGWLEQNFPADMDDQTIIYTIADEAREILSDLLRVHFSEAESVIAFYAITFDSIKQVLEELKNKKVASRGKDKDENVYADYNINVCDRFEIGFTDSKNTENEKIGSFTPHMYHLESNLRPFVREDMERKSYELGSEWFVTNVHSNPEVLHRIGTLAFSRLKKEADIVFNENCTELIIAAFCMVHDTVIKTLKEVFEERYKVDDINTYEVNCNVMNCYDAILRKDKDGNTKVSLKPSVSTKQETKNDDQATAVNE